MLAVWVTLGSALATGPDGDIDGDGLANGDESVLGTDPLASDTDGTAGPTGPRRRTAFRSTPTEMG